MKKVCLTLCFCFISFQVYCQEKNSNELRIGTNIGAYDGYTLSDLKSPVLFVEYDIKFKNFIYGSPFLLMGHGSESRNILPDGSYKQLSVTTTLHVGFWLSSYLFHENLTTLNSFRD